VIDANILLDWLLDRDAERTKRIDRLFATAEVLHIPDVVVVELAFALEKFYEISREIVIENINTVLDEPVFNCNRALFGGVLMAYGDRPALSFVDCCLLQYADLQHVTPVWTFDQKLVKQSAGRAKLPG
jgi:predicted nucleic-acid-binding protein